jgi:hypothetical protein
MRSSRAIYTTDLISASERRGGSSGAGSQVAAGCGQSRPFSTTSDYPIDYRLGLKFWTLNA